MSRHKAKLQQLLRYKNHTRQNSTSSYILQILYPNHCMTVNKMTDFVCSKSHTYTKKILQRLVHAGYVDVVNNTQKKHKRKYHLTQMGRWFALSCRLRITFLSLCLLAEVYYVVKDKNESRLFPDAKNHERVPEFYMISSFRRLFDASCQDSISAIYSKRSISKAAQSLVDRKLTYRPYRSDILRITTDNLSKLQRYDYDLHRLHQWNYDISSKCRDMFVEDHAMTDKQKRLFSLAC